MAVGGVAPTPQERLDGAGYVESYRCTQSCPDLTRFPRYGGMPKILFETRRGRCGEWANVSTRKRKEFFWPVSSLFGCSGAKLSKWFKVSCIKFPPLTVGSSSCWMCFFSALRSFVEHWDTTHDMCTIPRTTYGQKSGANIRNDGFIVILVKQLMINHSCIRLDGENP